MTVIILNPVSGKGDAKLNQKVIRETMQANGWHGKIVLTKKNMTAAPIARQVIKEGCRHIIACGGDGTIREVLSVVRNTNVSVGVVPLGSANLFAKNLDIPTDISEAVKVAFSGKTKVIDIGKANEHYFSIMAGMGIDVELMRQTDRDLKNKFGSGAYLLSLAKSAQRSPSRYRISIDGAARTYRAKGVLIANMGTVTGGITIVPHAHPESGKLQVGIIRIPSWTSWFSLLFNALRGRVHDSRYYTLLNGREIEIAPLNGPEAYECDGENFPATEKLSVTISPSSAAIKVPAPSRYP